MLLILDKNLKLNPTQTRSLHEVTYSIEQCIKFMKVKIHLNQLNIKIKDTIIDIESNLV